MQVDADPSSCDYGSNTCVTEITGLRGFASQFGWFCGIVRPLP